MKKAVMLVSFAWPLLAYSQVQPGNWELTVTAEIDGKEVGPTVRTQCFTEQDAQDPERVLDAKGTCEFSNRQERPGVLIFDVKCGGALPMSGRGRVRHDAGSFESDLDLGVDSQAAGGGPAALRTNIKGRRLGPC